MKIQKIIDQYAYKEFNARALEGAFISMISNYNLSNIVIADIVFNVHFLLVGFNDDIEKFEEMYREYSSFDLCQACRILRPDEYDYYKDLFLKEYLATRSAPFGSLEEASQQVSELLEEFSSQTEKLEGVFTKKS